jgi:hypothetical protein
VRDRKKQGHEEFQAAHFVVNKLISFIKGVCCTCAPCASLTLRQSLLLLTWWQLSRIRVPATSTSLAAYAGAATAGGRLACSKVPGDKQNDGQQGHRLRQTHCKRCFDA